MKTYRQINAAVESRLAAAALECETAVHSAIAAGDESRAASALPCLAALDPERAAELADRYGMEGA